MRGGLRLAPLSSFALLALLALVACSAAPGDRTGSSDEALVEPVSGGSGGVGVVHESAPPVCSFLIPTPPPTSVDNVIVAWAAYPGASGCPAIAGDQGVWAEINSIAPPANLDQIIDFPFNGVPTDLLLSAEYESPSCTSVPGMPTNCCTYVWWPAGWATNPLESSPPQQDSAALCQENGEVFFAIEEGDDVSCYIDDGRLTCDRPSGGGCASCRGT